MEGLHATCTERVPNRVAISYDQRVCLTRKILPVILDDTEGSLSPVLPTICRRQEPIPIIAIHAILHCAAATYIRAMCNENNRDIICRLGDIAVALAPCAARGILRSEEHT